MDNNWIKIETYNKEVYNQKGVFFKITKYWLPNVLLKDTEFSLYGIINHTRNEKAVHLLASDTDYTKPGDGTQTKSGLIAGVIGSIPHNLTNAIILSLLQGGGLGYNDACMHVYIEEKTVSFDYNFCTENDPHAELSYCDAIKLFHAYFHAFKIFSEQENMKYLKKRWYEVFLEKLPELNELYKEMVKKGEIEK